MSIGTTTRVASLSDMSSRTNETRQSEAGRKAASRSRNKYDTFGLIDKGKLKVRNQAEFERAMREMADGEVIVTIRSAQATRTVAMNRLYWRWYVQPLSEYTGYGPDAIHQYLKRRFLASTRLVIVDPNGEIVDETDLDATTTTLTKDEFSEYLLHISEFAETLNVSVGIPVEDRAYSYE